MPGDPQDVKATPLNSTSIHVSWKPPLEKDRNGIIRGYHIHVQEMRDEVGGNGVMAKSIVETNWTVTTC